MAELTPRMKELVQPYLAGIEPYDPNFTPTRINLSANENTYPVPAGVREAIDAALAATPLNRYPDPMSNDLRDELAAWHGVTRENICVGNGGDELLYNYLLAFGGAGRTLLNCPPCFSEYAFFASLCQTEVRDVWRDPATFELDQAAVLAAAPECNLAIVTSPNNPTGDVAPLDFVAALCDACPGMVMVDEAYVEFADDSFGAATTAQGLIAEHPNLAILHTLSKAFGAAGTRLIAQTEKIVLSAARHPAEATLRRLFAFAGNDSAQSLSPDVTLQLSTVNPVEISGDTATVNLAASALSLSHSDLYVVCQAIANTLTQWGDIRYVNVLVSSIQPGLDVGASVPAGCFAANAADTIDAMLTASQTQSAAPADRRISLNATLYYPTYSGKGILAETRTLSFAGRDKGEMIKTLLSALSQGAQTLGNTPAMPDLSVYLTEAPAVQEIAVSGGQCAVLRFTQSFNDVLIAAGIPRSVMMAALTYTLTTFVPGLSGVTAYIGDELVSVVVPGGVYEGADEPVNFQNGVMRRSDFSHFLLSNCTLYFSDGAGHLTAVQRPIPYYETRSARYLINCLMQGPQPCDNAPGIQTVLPDTLGDADVLGLGLSGTTLLLNLSQHAAADMAQVEPASERLMVYALVNTLTELRGVSGVCFFFAGAQRDSLAGVIYWPGVFLRDGSIVQ